MTRQLRNMRDLAPGDHVCAIYEQEAQLLTVVRDFIQARIANRHRVICVSDDPSPTQWVQHLSAMGLDIAAWTARQQLIFLEIQHTYLQGGRFDPQVMLDLLRREAARAQADGYAGLSVTGTASWALAKVPGADRWIEYEVYVNEFMPLSGCVGLCLFDARRFRPEQLIDVLRTHPWVILQGQFHENIFYIPPTQLLQPDRHARVYQHLLDALAKHRQIEMSRLDFQQQLESLVRQRTAELHASEQRAHELALHHARLLKEVNHRVKNNLSAILALISLTGQRTRDPRQLLHALEDRILSISQAHDLLSRHAWQNLDFGHLAKTILSTLGAAYLQQSRVSLDGPPLALTAPMATPLALILQELFTNSTKYGALSQSSGRVLLHWHQIDPSSWTFTWQEVDGPPISKPFTPGLGTEIIVGLTKRDLGGTVELQLPPNGLLCRFHFPKPAPSPDKIPNQDSQDQTEPIVSPS